MPYVRKEFGENENTIAYRKHQQEPAVTSYGGAALRGAVLYRAVAGQLCFGGRTAGIGNGRIEFLEEFVGERMIRLYKAVKLAFDDKLILNPGKVIEYNK